MATLSASTIVEIQSGATAGNVNGGGFNPVNANFMTDLTTDANTANTSAPIVSSASYNFAATDVNHWLYIQSGTNWTAGWYKIASVASNKATLSAAVGSASVRQVVYNRFGTNTVIGCATTGTPTGGVFSIDYSQGTTAIAAFTNLGSANGSTTLTDNSAGGLFTKAMVGNLICLSAGTNCTVKWYEIVSFTNSNNVVLNVTPHGANTMSATTGKVGGAISLGGSTANITDNNVFSTLVISSSTAATRFFVKGSATYTLAVAVTQTAADAAWPVIIEGYATNRGDRPTGSTRPVFACGANIYTRNGLDFITSMQFTGTGTSVCFGSTSSDGTIISCKATNTSTTAGRAAFGGGGKYINCEGISYRGSAFILPAAASVPTGYFYNEAHDSNIGFSADTTGNGSITLLSGNIVRGCVTSAIDTTGTINCNTIIMNNTLYGAENKLGTGMNFVTALGRILAMNNNIYGFATGIAHADVQASGYGDYNNFFNNTVDINTANHWQKGFNDTALNPNFASVSQVTGATATTTTGNHLVQSGATFVTSGVTAGRDYVYIKSGTGVTAGIYGILSVDSETQITADITLVADATADKVWQITVGHNLAITNPLTKSLGCPSTFPAGFTTSYTEAGAVQIVSPNFNILKPSIIGV